MSGVKFEPSGRKLSTPAGLDFMSIKISDIQLFQKGSHLRNRVVLIILEPAE